MREKLAQLLMIFPSGCRCRRTAPLDEDLRHRSPPFDTSPGLKDLHRYLKLKVRRRQVRRHRLPRTNTGLELRDMEHWMHSAGRWQVKLVSHLPNALKHCERPEELEGELVVVAAMNRLLQVWLQT
jgi:hypothetical protein